MRAVMILAGLSLFAAAPAAQAQIQNDTGVPTQTQERLRSGAADEFPWDLLGLFGLVGLLGLRRSGHQEDSYHPAPME